VFCRQSVSAAEFRRKARSVYYRRNPGMLFYLIKCRARGDGAVIARPEDSAAAARLYAAFSGTAGGQETKLTRNEAAAIATVARMGVEVFTVSDGGPAQFHSSQLPSANAGDLLARSR